MTAQTQTHSHSLETVKTFVDCEGNTYTVDRCAFFVGEDEKVSYVATVTDPQGEAVAMGAGEDEHWAIAFAACDLGGYNLTDALRKAAKAQAAE